MLSGRTFAVTGANTGVGRATAAALAKRGARVLLLCRRPARAREIVAEIAGSPGRCDVVPLDLADLRSVFEAAAQVASTGERLDALINNAGVGGARGVTQDGFELAFGVNYLGHYALTRMLVDRVDRVVHVTSGAHARAPRPDFRRFVRGTRSLTGIREYSVSKLCVMLFHHELSRRSARVISVAADPGDVASDAYRHVPRLVRPLVVRGMKAPAEGATTSVFCATTPGLPSGSSFVDCRPFDASRLSRDARLARELWTRSAAWVGLSA